MTAREANPPAVFRGDLALSKTAAGLPDPEDRPSGLARARRLVPPPGLVLMAILSMQVGAAVAIGLFAQLGPVRAACLRLAFSAAILLIMTRPRLDRALLRHAGVLLPFGAALGGMTLAIYTALARLPLGVAVTVEFLGPLCLASLTARRRIDFLWIGLAVIGIGLLAPIAGGTAALDPLGLGAALLAACGWAGFVVFSKRVGTAIPGHAGLALGLAIGALLVLPCGFMASAGALPPLGAVLGMALVAVFSTAVPFSLEFEALRRMPPKTYGVLVTLEPAVASLVGVVLLHQTLGPRALVAMVCVTIAAMGATLTKQG